MYSPIPDLSNSRIILAIGKCMVLVNNSVITALRRLPESLRSMADGIRHL